jgi:hypothetical protein
MYMGLIMLDMHTPEPLVSEPNSFEDESAVEKLRRYKSPGIYEITTELQQAGGNTLCSEIHKLVNSI